MRPATNILVLFLLAAPPLASGFTAQIAIQAIHPRNPPPTFLAEIAYLEPPAVDLLAAGPLVENDEGVEVAEAGLPPKLAELRSYEPPEGLPEGVALVRVGAWDPHTGTFSSATTVTSARAFERGYAPALSVSADPATGAVISVALRGVRVDAANTRDFGPRVEVWAPARGKEPELNRPVVLTPDGKRPAAEENKSFLQKYWWIIAIMLCISMVGGGGGDGPREEKAE